MLPLQFISCQNRILQESPIYFITAVKKTNPYFNNLLLRDNIKNSFGDKLFGELFVAKLRHRINSNNKLD